MAHKRDTVLISLTKPELELIEKSVRDFVREGHLAKTYDFLSFWQMEQADEHVVVMIGLFEAMACIHVLPGTSTALDRIRKVRNRLLIAGLHPKTESQSKAEPSQTSDSDSKQESAWGSDSRVGSESESKESNEEERVVQISLNKHQMQVLCQCINHFDPLAIAYGYMTHWLRLWLRSSDGCVELPVALKDTERVLEALREYEPKASELIKKFSQARTAKAPKTEALRTPA